jgi:hypothetical protein
MYVMEAREEVEGTPANDTARLQALLDTNQSLEQRCIQVQGTGGTNLDQRCLSAWLLNVLDVESASWAPATRLARFCSHSCGTCAIAYLCNRLTPAWLRALQELSAAFAAGDLQHAAELTTQLRYICRIREAIVEKM